MTDSATPMAHDEAPLHALTALVAREPSVAGALAQVGPAH